MKTKKILIPTDFSENAQNAIEYALDLYREAPLKITFLNAYHVPVVTPELPADTYFQSIDDSKELAKEELFKLCQRVMKENKNFKADFLIKQDPVFNACNEAVKEKKIELIVMGTHGGSGLNKLLLLGSNAAKVIGSASCPVLAIPEKAKFWKMKKMLFASDFHDSDAMNIAYLAELAELHDSEIMVVHISEGMEADSAKMRWYENLIRKKTEYKNLSFSLLGKADILQTLDNFIDENEVELLAMSTRKRSLFEKFFSPSLTNKMVYHTSIPLLAFHAREKQEEKLKMEEAAGKTH